MENFCKLVAKVDILIDIRKRPQSQYYPHFNRGNMEKTFSTKYMFR